MRVYVANQECPYILEERRWQHDQHEVMQQIERVTYNLSEKRQQCDQQVVQPIKSIIYLLR